MSDQDFSNNAGPLAVDIGFDDLLGDDDDDDPGANIQDWVGARRNVGKGIGKGHAGGQNVATSPIQQLAAPQLKQLAGGAVGGDPDAKRLLAQHRDNINSGPMTQRSAKKKRAAAWTAGLAGAGGVGLGAVNSAMGGAALGGATLSGATGWAAVAGGGVSLLGGPFALLAAGTALSLGGSIRQGRATYKTNKHIQNLEKILTMAARDEMYCDARTSADHHNIVHVVLPYIIQQKKKKRMRKAARTLPVLGNIETARSMMRKSMKLWSKTNGKQRGIKAEQLALHHVQTNCAVTSAIIAELFSVDIAVAEEARFLDSSELGPILETKMKSV